MKQSKVWKNTKYVKNPNDTFRIHGNAFSTTADGETTL
jgi:hypothetical protein